MKDVYKRQGSWYEKPYGWIELYKSSANGSISDGNGNYSLKGAKYGIYQGETQVEVLTTDENGYAKSGELEEGSYTLREIEASPGFAIDTNGYDVTVEPDVTATLKVQEVPQNNPMDIVLQDVYKRQNRKCFLWTNRLLRWIQFPHPR